MDLTKIPEVEEGISALAELVSMLLLETASVEAIEEGVLAGARAIICICANKLSYPPEIQPGSSLSHKPEI